MTPDASTLNAFKKDLDALHRRTVEGLGARHYGHLRSVERWVWALSLLGYGTAWLGLNPVAVLGVGLAQTARWAILAHHILHKGYDRIPGVARRHTSRGFAVGWRRFWDWPDWILPEAWVFEHNTLHHGHTGETLDPDLVERNLHELRIRPWPTPVKWMVVAFFSVHWKLSYYAPNLVWLWRKRAELKAGARDLRVDRVYLSEPARFHHGAKVLLPLTTGGLAFWGSSVLPYVAYRFVLLPLLFWPLGKEACMAVLLNSLVAEAFTNIHTYLIIVPNHAGDDLQRFEGSAESKAEFYYRQVVGSANYPGGVPWRDFLYGYLNYQIEHHLWPNLPALAYREVAPEVRALCAKHGVPYVEEPVRRRFRKLAAIMMGERSMLRSGGPVAPPSPSSTTLALSAKAPRAEPSSP